MTVACALGILASGACFQPSPRYNPRVPLLAPGTKLHVVVVNTSDTKEIDAGQFARVIAKRIELSDRVVPVQNGEENSADVELRVMITDEELNFSGHGRCRARVFTTVTRADGQILWNQTVSIVVLRFLYSDVPKGSDALRDSVNQTRLINKLTSDLWLLYEQHY